MIMQSQGNFNSTYANKRMYTQGTISGKIGMGIEDYKTIMSLIKYNEPYESADWKERIFPSNAIGDYELKQYQIVWSLSGKNTGLGVLNGIEFSGTYQDLLDQFVFQGVCNRNIQLKEMANSESSTIALVKAGECPYQYNLPCGAIIQGQYWRVGIVDNGKELNPNDKLTIQNRRIEWATIPVHPKDFEKYRYLIIGCASNDAKSGEMFNYIIGKP